MTTTITKQYITEITVQDTYLTVFFSKSWFQEDIEELTQLAFFPLNSVTIQEKILGADRENIRFTWQDHYFILNFDCCSQSCWFEGQGDESTESLAKLYSALYGLVLVRN